jgi:hypothetical protein
MGPAVTPDLSGGASSVSSTGIGQSSSVASDVLVKHYRYSKCEAVFNRLDVGGNGCISFAEYLTTLEKLTEEDVKAARVAFELLRPDKSGNVRKRKFIETQIMAYEDVPDGEFDRWVHIMTKGSIVHPHRRKDLEAAGVEIPEDYVDPPSNTLSRAVGYVARAAYRRLYRFLFAASLRQRVAAYELSANARLKHIRVIQALQAKLDAHDKTLLDKEHALAIAALERKSASRGTLSPPVERERDALLDKPLSDPHSPGSRLRNLDREFEQSRREEKENDETARRGLKKGNEVPPLPYESSEMRLRASRAFVKQQREERLAEDLLAAPRPETDEEQPDDSFTIGSKLNPPSTPSNSSKSRMVRPAGLQPRSPRMPSAERA